MRSYLLRPKAVSDLEKIWDYTVDKWGQEQAEEYLRKINECFSEIAKEPSSGISCDSLRKGYYKFRIEKHVIFYRFSDKKVDVVRVLHQVMDFPRHL